MPVDSYPNCRFYVEIGGMAQAVFTEVSGLQLEMEVTDYQEGGNNDFVHRLPGRTKSSNLILKRGMTNSNEFFQWYAELAQGKITPKNVSVVMYDVTGNVLARWNLIKAYPVKWIGPQFNAHDAAAAVETLELAHERLELA
ncbi:MAG TPA: phage tail protein [Ktedonobacterales bacterium]|nr:phage tail protein [Ktedonobacterales bacterium]